MLKLLLILTLQQLAQSAVKMITPTLQPREPPPYCSKDVCYKSLPSDQDWWFLSHQGVTFDSQQTARDVERCHIHCLEKVCWSHHDYTILHTLEALVRLIKILLQFFKVENTTVPSKGEVDLYSFNSSEPKICAKQCVGRVLGLSAVVSWDTHCTLCTCDIHTVHSVQTAHILDTLYNCTYKSVHSHTHIGAMPELFNLWPKQQFHHWWRWDQHWWQSKHTTTTPTITPVFSALSSYYRYPRWTNQANTAPPTHKLHRTESLWVSSIFTGRQHVWRQYSRSCVDSEKRKSKVICLTSK